MTQTIYLSDAVHHAIKNDDATPSVASLRQIIHDYQLTVRPVSMCPETGYFLTAVENTEPSNQTEKFTIAMQQWHPEKATVAVTFESGSNAHRRKYGGGLGQDFTKAIGVSSAIRPSVIDTTAGLGRDSFVLASCGCQVIAFERQCSVAALLADGLRRAEADTETADITRRIQLFFGDGQQLLNAGIRHSDMDPEEGFAADVIYLDPMFEHDPRQKAKVKKDMQAFRQLVGPDEDTASLLDTALKYARCRVVVKRARKASFLADKKPSYSITGKSNRFDVYALRKLEPRA